MPLAKGEWMASSACPSASLRSRWQLRSRGIICVALIVICGLAGPNYADDLLNAQKLYWRGEYKECLEATTKGIEAGEWRDAWRVLKIEAELSLGLYDQAKLTVDAALKRYTTDLPLRWVAFITYRLHGEAELAQKSLLELEALARDRPRRYSDTTSRVALGRYFLFRNADPRQVLELFYDKAKKDDVKSPEPYLASGELALAKHDFQLAAQEFRRAVKLDETRADAYFGLARALADSDGEAASEAIEKALELNPRHCDALILVAERLIDSERYAEALKTIAKAHKVNPHQSAGWALKAVIAHLQAEPKLQEQHRARALKYRSNNPEVDHRIGRKLSRKYRFQEGADHQRSALAMQEDFLPAKLQLCQDLLRLGEEEEGWKLANEVNQEDGYSVVAHNLVSLHDEIQKFKTLNADGLWVRMDRREADIYGKDVLALLIEAREKLVKKYQVVLREPVIVEIFPRQADFAIRTFGLPGGVGFLGVCFGQVITANSPASQTSNPTNWEAVLWHEYCHVVTLQKTSNRMPRWLSEGISVYEERQRNPAWGQTMSPEYREMVLGGELTPVSELSSAFLRPASANHLQFAYYQSSLVVEFLVKQHGFKTLLQVLDDLNVGMPINESLSRYTGGGEQFDKAFAEFAKSRAESLAPKVDFAKPEERLASAEQVIAWNSAHPNNYWGLIALAFGLIQAEEWEEAKQTLQDLQQRFPNDRSAMSPAKLLVRVERGLKDRAAELKALENWCEISNNDLEALLRITQLLVEDEDWGAAKTFVRKSLAVNPLRADLQQQRARVAEMSDDKEEAIHALESLAALGPIDPADVSYRLALLLEKQGDRVSAKRRVLQALEEAPRYLDAHRLLRRIVEAEQEKQPASAKNPAVPKPAEKKPAVPKPAEKKPAVPKPAAKKPAEPLSPPAGEIKDPKSKTEDKGQSGGDGQRGAKPLPAKEVKENKEQSP